MKHPDNDSLSKTEICCDGATVHSALLSEQYSITAVSVVVNC